MGKTNWIRTFAVVTMILGFIGAIIVGNAFPMYSGDGYFRNSDFNTPLFLLSTVSIIFVGAFFLALASIFEQVRDSAESMKAMLPKKTEEVQQESTAA